LSDHKLDFAIITRLLADQDLYVSELTPIQPDLESAFLDLTGGDRQRSQQQPQWSWQQQQPDRIRPPELPDRSRRR
jgi:hypothetical protein